MLTHFFASLFRKRCPLCKAEVHEQSTGAVQRFGKWCCSKEHADLYELNLYEALKTVHCHHAACHGEYVPLPDAVSLNLSPGHDRELSHVEQERQRCFARWR
jgi:hypothetical protein